MKDGGRWGGAGTRARPRATITTTTAPAWNNVIQQHICKACSVHISVNIVSLRCLFKSVVVVVVVARVVVAAQDCIIPYRCSCYCVHPLKLLESLRSPPPTLRLLQGIGFAEYIPANWLALPKSVLYLDTQTDTHTQVIIYVCGREGLF